MFIAYLIIIIAIINIVHIGVFLIGSDIYAVMEAKRNKMLKRRGLRLPRFSVLIPAHDEEVTIINTVQSVANNDYPTHLLQILVIDDGSTDKTADLLQRFKKANPQYNLDIITQYNAGKAHALNNGISNYATGELVMCLDADSTIAPNALREAAKYFVDKKVVAMAANIKIRPAKGLLNLIQKFEYLLGHRQKRGQSFYNIEYVIGGVGSVFRRTKLAEVGYYDTNTLTEDLDLTLKLASQGNKQWRIVFGANVIAYTEGVLTLPELLKQRYRWKLGFFQSLIKNKSLMFNMDKKHSKLFTLVWLPYVILSTVIFLINPPIIAYVFFHIIKYHDIASLLFGVVVVSANAIYNIFLENTLTLKEKVRFSLIAPSMYIFFYVIIGVEYIAIIKGLISLIKRTDITNTWSHVNRPKAM